MRGHYLVKFPNVQVFHTFQTSGAISANLQIQVFDFFARPRRSAQKLEAGFDAGVVGEAAYRDHFCHRSPARFFGKLGNHHFQSHAIKMVAPDVQSSTRQPTNT